MRKIAIFAISVLLLSGCSIPSFVKKKAGLTVKITGDEATTVLLNGIDIGPAPYKSNDLKPGSYSLKLAPQNSSKPPYETNIMLSSGLETVVLWKFGATAEESGGEVFELSKLSNTKKAELSIVTNPDNIIVKVDGQSKGFSPLILDDLAEGSHALTVSSPGYVERTSNPILVKGYRVTVSTKLGREPETSVPQTETAESGEETATLATSPKPSASPSSVKSSPKPASTPAASGSGTLNTGVIPPLPYVEVKETSTGWLRVRAEANAASTELAKLDVGSKVPYKNETVDGWLKVEYETGKEGWVSGQYAIVHSE